MWQEGNATHLRGATHLLVSASVNLHGCDPLKQQSPENCVLRPVLIQVDSNNLQTGFYHCSVDFYHACDEFDVGKEAMFGEEYINPTFTCKIIPQGFLEIYGQFCEKFENS